MYSEKGATARMLYSAFPALGPGLALLGRADGTPALDCDSCRHTEFTESSPCYKAC